MLQSALGVSFDSESRQQRRRDGEPQRAQHSALFRQRTTEAQRAQRQHRGDKDRSECLGRPMHIKKVWDVQETHDSSKTTHLLLSSVRPLCPLCLCGSLVRIARPTNGEEGIRTLETLTGLPVFKTGAFNHSATSPWGLRAIIVRHARRFRGAAGRGGCGRRGRARCARRRTRRVQVAASGGQGGPRREA